MEKSILMLTFNDIEVSFTVRGSLCLKFHAPSGETGIAPHLVPAVELSLAESRHLAQLLLSKAAWVESQG